MDLTTSLIVFSVIFFFILAFYVFFRRPAYRNRGKRADSISRNKKYNNIIIIMVLVYFVVFNLYTVFGKDVPFEGMTTGGIIFFIFNNLIGLTAIGLLIYSIRKKK